MVIATTSLDVILYAILTAEIDPDGKTTALSLRDADNQTCNPNLPSGPL